MKAAGWRWQDKAAGGGMMDVEHPSRRVVGLHEIRFEGLSDLMLHARGCSVFDVGCNRGHVAWDFAVNGARLVHGCDIDGPSIQCARMWFSEHPHVESKFEVVDLEKGAMAVHEAFGAASYDMVLLLGVQHKLKRVMKPEALGDLIKHLATRAKVYFAWNGYAEDLPFADRYADAAGLKQIHVSEMALPGRPAVVWKR